MKLLITGASGKVGQNFLPAFLEVERFADWRLQALCNNRTIAETDRISVVRGSIADPTVVGRAMEGVTHVLHMAAVKESPSLVIDVAIKGMFNLLESFRASPTAQQFILIGGDCAVGHIFQKYDAPITESMPRRAYPGCYALTKVLEEVMLEQYQIQYGLNGCCLRAPWIMEKDDFRFALKAGKTQFGGPDWSELLAPAEHARLVEEELVPVMMDFEGQPLRRNFVHVSDVVSGIITALANDATRGELFNISMDVAVNYAEVADYLRETRGYKHLEFATPFHSNQLDNSKARAILRWRPKVDMHDLIERAWTYARPADDPRRVHYPG